jgi:hypothetical protein
MGYLRRAFGVVLSRVWTNWANALIIVTPETAVRWHRAGFEQYRR